jgi:hypothetical protein
VNGFIGSEVQIGRVRVEIKAGRQTLETFLLSIGSHACRTQFRGLLERGLAPGTGDDVVGRSAGRAQVHGHHRKLQRGAALQEHHFIVGGNAKQFAQVCFRSLNDGFKLLRAMADLHHRHARAFEINEFRLSFFEHFERQGGRARIKVEDALGIGHEIHSCVGGLTNAQNAQILM